MSDILLTHSYFLKFDPKEHRAMMPYPPLGTLYAASYLETRGYSVALFDSMLAEHEEDILAPLRREQPKIVVIYDDDFNYLTKMCLSRMRDAAFTMTRFAKELGCTVVVHSSDSADHVDSYLHHGADFVVVGEGEITLGELADHLLGSVQGPLAKIDGLAYGLNGGSQRTAKRELLKNPDVLPMPARHLVDMNRYRQIWKRRHRYFSINMVTTRGCPFHCNWCAKPIYGQVYNVRSPENVVEEMRAVQRAYRPDHIWFCDDIFGLKPGWVARFAEAVKLRNTVIPFKCQARVDLLLKEDTIRHLARSGCHSVWVGAESGSQKILDAMEKGTTVEQIHIATRLLREHGIRVGFFLQYGYPGETREDIDRTLQMVRDCKPDEIGVSVSYPLPGTKFYEMMKQHMGEKRNWFNSQDLDLMFPGAFHPDFYRVLHRVTHKRLRMWQGADMLKSIVAEPWRLEKKTLRCLGAAAYHACTIPFEQARLNALSR